MSQNGCRALKAIGTTLAVLDLTFNPKISSGDFLADLPRLTELDCSLNAWFDDKAAAVLAASAPPLRKLTLEKTDVTDAGVAALGELAGSLEHLDLSRTAVCLATAESSSALESMTSLRSLFLAYTEVSAELAVHLPRALERLKLSRCIGFADEGLRLLAMKPPPSLQQLDVGSPYITPLSLSALQTIAEAGLTSLTLWHCKIDRQAADRLMAAAGLVKDTSMRSTEGTYIMKRLPAMADSYDAELAAVRELSVRELSGGGATSPPARDGLMVY